MSGLCQQIKHVGVQGAVPGAGLGVGHGFDGFAAGPLNVANGDELHVFLGDHTFEYVPSAGTDADGAKDNAFRGRDRAVAAQCLGGDEGGQNPDGGGGRCRGMSQKIASREAGRGGGGSSRFHGDSGPRRVLTARRMEGRRGEGCRAGATCGAKVGHSSGEGSLGRGKGMMRTPTGQVASAKPQFLCSGVLTFREPGRDCPVAVRQGPPELEMGPIRRPLVALRRCALGSEVHGKPGDCPSHVDLVDRLEASVRNNGAAVISRPGRNGGKCALGPGSPRGLRRW